MLMNYSFPPYYLNPSLLLNSSFFKQDNLTRMTKSMGSESHKKIKKKNGQSGLMFIDFDDYTRYFRICNSTGSRDTHIYIMEFLALSNFQAKKKSRRIEPLRICQSHLHQKSYFTHSLTVRRTDDKTDKGCNGVASLLKRKNNVSIIIQVMKRA